ncbi:uncharacterized protein LOC119271045 [Triticum dicoccoides]|uniref:uncharacterized protein LOC119271045 n=1 Tax=Triticum dicoccoides TaxID=85692 RepID=UPI0018909BFD|nr:uncharacterized protein LOC119271045 [Triticum dicoccoides]
MAPSPRAKSSRAPEPCAVAFLHAREPPPNVSFLAPIQQATSKPRFRASPELRPSPGMAVRPAASPASCSSRRPVRRPGEPDLSVALASTSVPMASRPRRSPVSMLRQGLEPSTSRSPHHAYFSLPLLRFFSFPWFALSFSLQDLPWTPRSTAPTHASGSLTVVVA